MATAHEFLVIQTKDGIVGVEEVGMEDDFNTVARLVEQLHTANLVENRVICVVGHVMRHDRREGIALQGEDAPLEEDLVFARE